MIITRYDLNVTHGGCYDKCLAIIDKHPKGDYVRHEDYEELLERFKELKKIKSRWNKIAEEI